MQSSDCRVTVVIPVYNSAATVRRAVESVLRQTLSDLELLIVDDASTDASLEIVHDLAAIDHRIRVIGLPRNGGKAHAMNRAAELAHGGWLAVLDADDWYEPDRLATLIDAAERGSVDLVADNQFAWDATAGAMVRTAFATHAGNRYLTEATLIAGSDPYAEFDFGMLKPVVRMQFVRQQGLSYRENARLSEDFLYLVDFIAAGGVGLVIDKPLYHWTQPFGSLSRQWTTTGGGSWRYDYQSALMANTEAMRGLQQHSKRALAGLLARRGAALRSLARMSEISRLRASGAGMSHVLMQIARHPSVWRPVVRRVCQRIRARRESVSQLRQVSYFSRDRVDSTAT